MFSPQDWAIALTKARYKATHELKIPRGSNSDVGSVDMARLESIEATLVDFQTAFNNLVDALRETDEKLGRAEGMLRFCYAICQSPGIKDLAERTKERASDRLSSFGGFGNRNGRDDNGGGYPKPRAGLGAAGAPPRKL